MTGSTPIAKRALAASIAAAMAVVGLAVSACGGGSSRLGPAAGSPRPGSTIVNAAGSSYAAPIYQEVGNRMQNSGLTFNYQLVDGLVAAHLRPRLAPVVASESALGLRDLPRLRGSSQLLVPVAFSAVAVTYNLPGLRAALHLRGSVLAAIYQQRIRSWNDKRIAADNPGVTLPRTPIAVVHRSDPALVSELFTLYLSQSSRQWRRGPGSGPTVDWPAGTAVSGDDGLRQVVSQTPGAIGYTDQATALQNKLDTALLRNFAGAYVAPTIRATTAVGRQPHDRAISASRRSTRVCRAHTRLPPRSTC